LNRAVLRIMNDSTDRAEDRGEDGSGQQEQPAKKWNANEAHKFSNRLVGRHLKDYRPRIAAVLPQR